MMPLTSVMYRNLMQGYLWKTWWDVCAEDVKIVVYFNKMHRFLINVRTASGFRQKVAIKTVCTGPYLRGGGMGSTPPKMSRRKFLAMRCQEKPFWRL